MDSVKLQLLVKQPEIHSLSCLALTILISIASLFCCSVWLSGSIFVIGLAVAKKFGMGRSANITSNPSLSGKNVIVTGANCGIGYETAKELAKKGASVTIACRSESRAKAAVDSLKKEISSKDVQIDYMILDLSNLQSVVDFVKNWGDKRVDILINNAGIMQCPYNLSSQGYELQFATNHLGHFLLTNLLLPKIDNDGRIVNLTSMGHIYCSNPIDWRNLADKNSYDPSIAYGNSKIANIYFTSELQNKLKEQGKNTMVFAVHPGVVRTELIRSYSAFAQLIMGPLLFIIARTPNGGAQTSLFCATATKQKLTAGRYYNDCTVATPSVQAQDKAVAKNLWDLSLEFCGDFIKNK